MSEDNDSKYNKAANYNNRSTESPSKLFVAKNSPLTDLYENKHMQAVLHVFVMILTGQVLHSAATDLLYDGRLNLGIDLIQRSFANFQWILLIWTALFISTVLVFFAFQLWAILRNTLKDNRALMSAWDLICLALVMLYYVAFFTWPVWALHVCNIQPAAKFGFSCEILRMVMKAHAFIRTNAPLVLDNKSKKRPEFKSYFYFLWAPTLIYRDHYLRTPCIRWKFVFTYVLQFIAVFFFGSFLMEKYIVNVFKDYGRKPLIWQEVVVTIFENVPAGAGILLSLFFVIQHAWMNICAELFTFADRLFYQDWWTVTCFKDFYRKWNMIVQNWLYTYIYKDFYEIIIPKNKVAANYIIFFISAIAHEYITGLSFGFFLPILFVLFFGVGAQIVNLEFKNRIVANVFVYYGISLGLSILSTVFSIEYFYRVNCPADNVTFTSYLIPRVLTCQF